MKTAEEVIQKWTREFLLENPLFVHNGYSVADILEWLAKKQLASQFHPSPKEISEEEIQEWHKPDEKGIINVPDWLDPLVNNIAFQFRLHTISGHNEVECVCRAAYMAQKFFASHPSSSSKTEEVELPEDIQDFIDGIERIKAQLKNGKYSYAEKTKQELINKLNDIV